MPNKWEFPGGKINSGETPKKAVIREITEELSCLVNPLDVRKANIHNYLNFSINLIPLICEVVKGEPRALEHQEIKWVLPRNFYQFDWAEADIPIFQDYLEKLQSNLYF